jgi:23S rRNA (adenine2503-C2)-methyltransferase
MKRCFYEVEPGELKAWLTGRGEPAYRARQILEAVYQQGCTDFMAISNLPLNLRNRLQTTYELGPLAPLAVQRGSESEKLLLALPDGGQVECVRIQMDGASTACVSSQVGCQVRCSFCATGRQGYERSLTASEILWQVVTLSSLGERVRNVVFMGMGEPFHNYANVVEAIRRLIDKEAFAYSPGRLTVSTAGVVPAIHRYAEEGLPTELTVSLNATTDELRRQLMPGVSRWPLTRLLEACRHFSEAHQGQPVTFAYVLLNGLNDNFDDATRLAKLLAHQPHHLNLIPYNTTASNAFEAPPYPRTRAFLQACRRAGLNASLRHSKGGDIEAACGQLRGDHQVGRDTR